MSQLSQDYLNLVRKIFEKRYNRKLTDEEVSVIADRLINFGRVFQNFYKKKNEAYGDKYEIWYKEFSESAKNAD